MATIQHRIGIKADIEIVYLALTTVEGLAKWWIENTRGNSTPGEVIEFWFGDTCVEMKVIEHSAPNKVVWHVLATTGEWMGTLISFELEQQEQQTFVNFQHADWQQASKLFSHCNTKWAVFLLSLKDYIENGKGKPYPNDVQIDCN